MSHELVDFKDNGLVCDDPVKMVLLLYESESVWDVDEDEDVAVSEGVDELRERMDEKDDARAATEVEFTEPDEIDLMPLVASSRSEEAHV